MIEKDWSGETFEGKVISSAFAKKVMCSGCMIVESVMTRSEPFGSGFAATERMVLAVDPEFWAAATWNAGDAHSGFFSAWLGAGWAGVLLVLLIFVSVWLRSTRLHPQLRALTSSLIVMLFISQLGITSVGAVLNPVFVVMMAIACIPGKLALAPTSSEGRARL